MTTGRKDTARLVRAARKAGAVVALTGHNHWRVTNPATGGAVTLSFSPSCPFALTKQRKDLRGIGLDL